MENKEENLYIEKRKNYGGTLFIYKQIKRVRIYFQKSWGNFIR